MDTIYTIDEMLSLSNQIQVGLQHLSTLDTDGIECKEAIRALVEANKQVWTLVVAHKVGDNI
jgi:hypothetical protein